MTTQGNPPTTTTPATCAADYESGASQRVNDTDAHSAATAAASGSNTIHANLGSEGA